MNHSSPATTTIKTTPAGRIAVALPVLPLAPMALIGVIGLFAAEEDLSFRLGFFFLLGLPLSALCVVMIRGALRPDALTMVVSDTWLEMHIGPSTLSYSRASTLRVFLQSAQAGVVAIAPEVIGQEPRYLATGWRWRRIGPVQRALTAHGWPSVVTSPYWGRSEFHPVTPPLRPPPPEPTKTPRLLTSGPLTTGKGASIVISTSFPRWWYACDVVAGADPIAIAAAVEAGIAGRPDLELVRSSIIGGLTDHATEVRAGDACIAAFRFGIHPVHDIVTASGELSVLRRERTPVARGLDQIESMLDTAASRKGWQTAPVVQRVELPAGRAVRRDLIRQTSVSEPSADPGTHLASIRTEYWIPITEDRLVLATFSTVQLDAAKLLCDEFCQIAESLEVSIEG